jgi:hypothetical protein
MDYVKGDKSGKFTASLGLTQSMKQRGARTRKGQEGVFIFGRKKENALWGEQRAFTLPLS